MNSQHHWGGNLKSCIYIVINFFVPLACCHFSHRFELSAEFCLFFWFTTCTDGSHCMYIHRPLVWMMNTVRKENVFCALTKVICIFVCDWKLLVRLLSDWELNSNQVKCWSFTDWQQSDTWIRRSVDCTCFCSLLSWLVWICRCSSNPHHHWGKCCSIRIFRFVLSCTCAPVECGNFQIDVLMNWVEFKKHKNYRELYTNVI